MKICFFTNTFLPHVGGVAKSVQTFLEDYRRLRQRVLVVAPQFAEGGAPERIERSVERVPALQNFNGSDFSVSLPLSTESTERITGFKPDLLHAHHPFLLGDTALRASAMTGAPVVFTHHTLYEQYTHYVPFDSPRLKEFVIELSTRFANRCHGVIAPSESIAELLVSRGVTTPIRVVPTGIDTKALASGSRARGRKQWNIPSDAVVIGHLGRLAPEKNLTFLSEAVVRTLKREKNAWLLVVGDGPSREEMEKIMATHNVADRVRFAGKLTGKALHDAYAAMDVFAFASQSETQGMVLAEAMAAGNPVIALDASGAREIVRDKENGRLLKADASTVDFSRALNQVVRSAELRKKWSKGAREQAANFDRVVTSVKALEFYREVIAAHRRDQPRIEEQSLWERTKERLAIEGQLVADKVGAAVKAITAPLSQLAAS
ncbi:glycosyl transferase family 1 [Nibricoccus aquaticus]|uniref:Glycosyl transferase family 1 n=1 Tax=Nibricoccus aquaticus TaxID=2576891 RepID=A0A290QBN7_9BACT|nr:glycosyltransferase [Nibricoccus aquaticus]ATC62728.1 glycosyl transferase family 1 [Nibricoccus aquaticus]